jgi:hypothetical protein
VDIQACNQIVRSLHDSLLRQTGGERIKG